jgi:hypothetical protein
MRALLLFSLAMAACDARPIELPGQSPAASPPPMNTSPPMNAASPTSSYCPGVTLTVTADPPISGVALYRFAQSGSPRVILVMASAPTLPPAFVKCVQFSLVAGAPDVATLIVDALDASDHELAQGSTKVSTQPGGTAEVTLSNAGF